jgi:hypothetical protein
MLASRLRELTEEANVFFEEGIKSIRKARGETVRVVFIFDQLEQLRGPLQSEQQIIQSVERIFSTYVDLLRIPRLHVIYTVPPWLKFVLPNTVPMTLLSTVHMWNNTPALERCRPAWSVFRSMIRRRLGDEGFKRLFGANPEAMADRLIGACGGHFRDLLRLLQDTVVRATPLNALPVPLTLIKETIGAARRDFLPIAQDDAKWLSEIARVRATALPSTETTPVNRLTRFLDNHSVLYFVNAEEWYDIHPLIRDEVEAVIKASSLELS